jgi:hypothetical protein
VCCILIFQSGVKNAPTGPTIIITDHAHPRAATQVVRPAAPPIDDDDDRTSAFVVTVGLLRLVALLEPEIHRVDPKFLS